MVALAVLLVFWVVVAPLLALVVAVRARDRAAALERRVLNLERGGTVPAAEPPPSVAASESVAPVPPPAAAVAPPPAVASPVAARTAVAPPERPAAPSLEERIGVTWFSRIGAAVLILGALYFFKYAIDNAWIGPWGRVALGVLAGAGMIVLAEREAGRADARWVQVLLGVGLAILYVAAYATYGFYRLLPEAAAFAALVVVAALGGALALRHRAQAVLLVSLAGALVAPRLLAGAEDRAAALFAYLLLVAAAAALVSLKERFRIAPWLAFAGVVTLWLLWYEAYFSVRPPAVDAVTGAAIAGSAGAYLSLAARALPLLFVAACSALWVWTARRARALGFAALPPEVLAAATVMLGQWGLGALLADRPAPAATAMVLSALAVTAVVDRLGAPLRTSLVAALAALAVLLAAASRTEGEAGVFLALAALWGGIYLAAAWRRLLADPAGRAPALLALVGPMGFVAVALVAVPASQGGLRAALAAGAGTALFALGAALLRRRPESRAVAAAMLGGAVGVITLAVGLAFSGVTITLLWAVLAAVVAALAAHRGDSVWLGGAAALFALVLCRLLLVDVAAPARDAMLSMATNGAEGRMAPPPLANPRALAMLGVAVALAVAAGRAVRRGPGEPWRSAAGAAATVAHVLLAGLVISEVRGLVTVLPAAPAGGLPPDEFARFLDSHYAAMAAQGGRRAVSATLALGAYGGMLLGVGFAARSVLHRWLGLLALGLTLGKLVLWDIWNLPRLFQVLVLVSVGALLLGAGFLYARFGRRLLGFLKGTAAFAAAALLATQAAALDVSRHASRATVAVPAGGYAVLQVPPELYHASATAGLADLRIAAPDGVEAPWLLRDRGPVEPVRELPAALLDPVVLPDGGASASFDLGAGDRHHNAIRLDLDGEAFVREARIEGSDGSGAWAAAGAGLVFRVAAGGSREERTTVVYTSSAARFVRVTIAGAPGLPAVRVRGGAVLLLPAEGESPAGTIPLAVSGRVDDAERKHTVLTLDAGGTGLPIAAVRLESGAARFSRRVAVEASDKGDYWVTAGCGVFYRAGNVESLRVTAATTKRHLRLVIDNGDDPPLPIAGVAAEYRLQELVFAAPRPGEYAFLAGCRDLAAPRYDLAEVLARETRATLTALTAGTVAANPAFAAAAEVPLPWSERHRVAIGIALALVLLAMAAWAARALRSR
jgi:uncharacterized membrane protein